jgi:hypothetical protein
MIDASTLDLCVASQRSYGARAALTHTRTLDDHSRQLS